jgi:hypothetical protein
MDILPCLPEFLVSLEDEIKANIKHKSPAIWIHYMANGPTTFLLKQQRNVIAKPTVAISQSCLCLCKNNNSLNCHVTGFSQTMFLK